MVRGDGVEATLKYLSTFGQEDAALPAAYLRSQLEGLLADRRDVLKLLIRAQGIPDGFDERLALGLAGGDAAEQLDALLARDVLRREGALIVIPDEVCAFIATLPPGRAKQAHLDRVIAQYFAQNMARTIRPLDAVSRARLNNVRARLSGDQRGACLCAGGAGACWWRRPGLRRQGWPGILRATPKPCAASFLRATTWPGCKWRWAA